MATQKTLHYFIKYDKGISGRVEVQVTATMGNICHEIHKKEDLWGRYSIVTSDLRLYAPSKLEVDPVETLFERVDRTLPYGALDIGDQVGETFTNVLYPELVHIVVIPRLSARFVSLKQKRRRISDSSQMSEHEYDGTCLIRHEEHPVVKMWKKYWGVALSAQLLGRPVSASDSRIEVEDGDLLPGAPFLEHLWHDQSFLVRAEYIRIHKFVEDSFAKNAKSSMVKPPAVIITGQPGIGKTVWISYALRRRLGEKRPTMLLLNGYYLFTEAGVKKVPDQSSFFMSNAYKKERPWCLIDSTNANNGIPLEISGNYQDGVNPVYVSSPDVSQWKRIHKTKRHYLAIMNPWTREEIDIASRMLFAKDHAVEALTRFDKYGPIPRICLEYRDSDIKEYESACQRAIYRVDDMAGELKSIITHGVDPSMGARRMNAGSAGLMLPDPSHMFLRIQRPDINTISGKYELLIMSKDIANRFVTKLSNDEV